MTLATTRLPATRRLTALLVASFLGTSWLSVPLADGVRAAVAAVLAPAAIDPSLPRVGTGEVSVVVQAAPGASGSVAAAVTAAGGSVGAQLPIIDGFAATVPASALESLSRVPGVQAISANATGTFSNLSYDESTTASNYTRSTGAQSAWAAGNRGEGVGVAVIDTGISPMRDLTHNLVVGPDLSGEQSMVDSYGHGTVMGGIIAGDGTDSAGRSGGAYMGVAPKATLVSVKIAGRNGAADVSTMLQAMHWVSAYKDQFNIRVLNLSWGVPSVQDPAVDPINYAVQRLWKQGVVVVVASGNAGPSNGTIMKPADDPLAITAGAYDDKQNLDAADDSIPSWASRGPTAHGRTKPDVVAPGRLVISTRSYGSAVEQENPKALYPPSYIRGSGTSQAAAVTSGVAALLIAARPELTPDQVKQVLKASASPIAGKSANDQGAGRIRYAQALSTPAGAPTQQSFTASGLGSIEQARGGSAGPHVQTDCFNDGTTDVIQGEISVLCEPWDGATWTGGTWNGGAWTGATWTGGTWNGGTWNGGTWNGGTWNGGTWNGGTWNGATWNGGTWNGGTWNGGTWNGATWNGGTWNGDNWTGGTWNGATWNGATWNGGTWNGGTWNGATWNGGTWNGENWTTGTYSEDDELAISGVIFASAFFGNKTKYGYKLPGEVMDQQPEYATGSATMTSAAVSTY